VSRRSELAPCCALDEGRSLGAALQEEASNHHERLSLNGDGRERHGQKGATRSRQVRMRETNVSEPLMKHRKLSGDIQTGASVLSRDKGVEGYLFTVHAVSGVQEA
jgi:hypothetical protein